MPARAHTHTAGTLEHAQRSLRIWTRVECYQCAHCDESNVYLSLCGNCRRVAYCSKVSTCIATPRMLRRSPGVSIDRLAQTQARVQACESRPLLAGTACVCSMVYAPVCGPNVNIQVHTIDRRTRARQRAAIDEDDYVSCGCISTTLH